MLEKEGESTQTVKKSGDLRRRQKQNILKARKLWPKVKKGLCILLFVLLPNLFLLVSQIVTRSEVQQ